ncbi:MAG: hypothetical protein OXI24_14690 [Candidatus Poribacteria bacterium]|nr:hypothetical protein [Candidatus Poribacteria bacterium]
MKTIFIFLSAILCFSFFLGCAETDNSAVTPQHLETDRSGPQEIQPQRISPPDIDITRYPKGWIHLTDSDVRELLRLEIPEKWWKTKNEAIREKMGHASMLKHYGILRSVLFIIEVERNFVRTPEINLKYVECLYFLHPSEQNKRLLDHVRANLPKDVPVPEPEDAPPRLPTVQQVKKERVALVKEHGDVPQVQIVVDFRMKMAIGQTFTLDEIFEFRKAKFELDPDEQPNRVIFEAYLQAKADGLPLHTVNEKKVIDEWVNDLEGN